MSLLDNVINAATSAISGNGEQSQAMQLVSQLIQQNGGNVGDLLGKLQQGGLGDALQSWIGTGSNASVDAAQIQNALGGSLSNAAAKVGLDTGSASNLAQRQRRRCRRLRLGRHRPHRDAKLFEISAQQISGCLIRNR